MGVRADIKFFDEELLPHYLPEVHAKFKEHNFNPTFFSLNWFTCLFQDKLADAVSHTLFNIFSFLMQLWTSYLLKEAIFYQELL